MFQLEITCRAHTFFKLYNKKKIIPNKSLVAETEAEALW